MEFEIPLSFNALPHQNYIKSKIGRNKKIIHYKDPKLKHYQDYIGYVAKNAAVKNRWRLCSKPFRISLRFVFNNNRHGDLDNCEKSLLDALEGILFTNDKLLQEKESKYEYGAEPKIFVNIEELC